MAATSSTTDDKPAGITCEKYVRGEGKRCRHYLANGGCTLPDELMCVEWLKVNGHRPPAAKPEAALAKDLFGNPVASTPPASRTRPATPHALPIVEAPPDAASEPKAPIRGFTTEDIESFKALGVEVCLTSEAFGELWLVPAYTGQSRKELTPEHAATIARVLDAFPGSQVVAFEKTAKGTTP